MPEGRTAKSAEEQAEDTADHLWDVEDHSSATDASTDEGEQAEELDEVLAALFGEAPGSASKGASDSLAAEAVEQASEAPDLMESVALQEDALVLDEEAELQPDTAVGLEGEQMPPPAVPSRAASSAGKASERDNALLLMQCDGGTLRYYKQGFFTATCNNPRHKRCTLTRTAAAGKKPAQGRPLGLMLAWLQWGEGLETRAQHWTRADWPSHESRSAQREAFSRREGAEDFLAFERELAPGEQGEPLGLA